MQPALPRLGHVRLTLRQDLRLARDLLQFTQHHTVALDKAVDQIADLGLGAEVLHECLQAAEIVARDAREEVVDGLELQAAVDEVEPGGAGDVHGGAELALGEGLGGAEVGGGGAPVGEGDLDVQGHGDEVGGQEEEGARVPGGDGAVEEDVEVEEAVGGDAEEFGGARPGGFAGGAGAGGEQVGPGEGVEVEARDGHYGVVGVVLEGHGDGGGGVPGEDAAVVG